MQEVSNVATLFVVMMFVGTAVPMSLPMPPSMPPSTPPLVCNPLSMGDCGGAFMFGGPPSRECCIELNAQKRCFCQYLKDPNLKPYIENPNAKRIAAACGVPIQKC
ncbi:non-specific lipid-transfer protein 2 [Tripterygium wilfordii]|uniref:Non-specific lipid-transfer protein 2 n=2 Tax=Tripterygium wilfordii TaxID=458696 RepID=A0A7J7DUX8_TRIWF|nr:non-specific lipid-transfer protein 2 [Tripterygium wilfordii]